MLRRRTCSADGASFPPERDMTGIAIACGMAAGLGLILIIRGTSRPQLRLADAMAALDRRQPAQVETDTRPAGLEGLGHQLHRGIGLPLTQTQQRLLNLQGRTVGDFFVEKLVWTLAGLLLPTLWALTQLLLGRQPGLAPRSRPPRRSGGATSSPTYGCATVPNSTGEPPSTASTPSSTSSSWSASPTRQLPRQPPTRPPSRMRRSSDASSDLERTHGADCRMNCAASPTNGTSPNLRLR